MNNSFIEQAFVEASKSNCPHASIGALLVKSGNILARAHNNIPSYIQECMRFGCKRERLNIESGTRVEMCNVVHAEQQLIINCALSGISPEGTDVYCTHSPCGVCAKMLVSAKIRSFFYSIDRETDQSFKKYFEKSDIIFGRI